MTISIKDFLNISIIKQARVKTSINTLSLRPIESISVIEIPVENFVRQNELVLSTAIGCNNAPEIFKEFIRDVFESGASALAVAVGGHVKKIPKEVIEYAEKLQFPIIEIPWDIRFADIMEAVLAQLNSRQQANLKCFEDLQKQLLTYYLNGSTLSDAAELIRQALGNPVVIVNTSGTLKGTSNKAEEFINSLTPCLLELLSDIDEGSFKKYNSEESCLIFRIQSGNILYGYLFLKSATDKTSKDHLINKKANIIRHVITPITLWFNREQAIYETEMHMRDDFVWNLAKGEIDSWDDVSSRAKSIGYNLSTSYVCIVGLLENMEEAYKTQKSNSTSYEQWLYDNIKNIKAQILRIGTYLKRAIMTTYQQDRLVIFLEVTNEESKESINRFLDLIEEKLKKLYCGIRISWGIGENHIGVKLFHKSFTDAKIALEVCYNQKGPGYRSTYNNISIYRMLSAVSSNQEVQEMIKLTIGKLIEYDIEHGLDLINTFKIYIQNKGNVSQTARALHLHRQSLLYRLKKIEVITNLSLENSDDLFLLDICVRLWATQTNTHS